MKFEQSFSLGNCTVLPMEYSIKFDGLDKVSLQPKFIEVLCYLAAQYPRVVPRDELIEQIWSSNNYVGEKALTNAVWHLRQALKPSDNGELVETIRKVGYRLLVEPHWHDKVHSKKEEDDCALPESQSKYANKWMLVAAPLLVAITLIVGVIFWPKDSLISTQQVSQITTLPGSELFASPSPDGKKIVFKWLSASANNNLFLKDLNNPKAPARQLTHGKLSVSQSVWSNDGQRLYFAKKDRVKDTCQIIEMNMNTTQERVLTDCYTTGGYYYIDISPDDSTLAYHDKKPPAKDSGIYLLNLTKPNSLPTRFSCDGKCGHRDRDFAFSPDGKTIAVTRRVNRFNENIYLVNIKTKLAKQITFGEEDIVGLTWHPNGKHIVYGAQRADVRNGYALNIKSGKSTNLFLSGFSYPQYSNLSHELFYQQRTEKYHLAAMALHNQVATSPLPVIESTFSHLYPDYSAATKRIAYVSNESGYYELWTADADGSNRKQETTLKKTMRYPRWSHSGKTIAFWAPTEGSTGAKIYLLDVATSKLTILPSPFQHHGRPTWTVDDLAIITATGQEDDTNLHQIAINDGSSKKITDDGGRYGVVTNDNFLLYTTAKNGLWRKDLKANTPPEKLVQSKQFTTSYAWYADKQGVYFLHNRDVFQQLSLYNYANNKVEPLIRLPRNSLSRSLGFSYIEQADALIFTRVNSPQSDIKKLELTH